MLTQATLMNRNHPRVSTRFWRYTCHPAWQTEWPDGVRCAPSKQPSSPTDSWCELVNSNGVALSITSDMTLNQLRSMALLINS